MNKMTTISSLVLTLMISACVQEQADLEAREQEQLVLPSTVLPPRSLAEEMFIAKSKTAGRKQSVVRTPATVPMSLGTAMQDYDSNAQPRKNRYRHRH